MAPRQQSPDDEAEEDERLMYGRMDPKEIREKYPSKPLNHAKTLPFHELFQNLFHPLNENHKTPKRPKAARGKPSGLSAHEQRNAIIERFISRWRQQVGNDFYPALRLILPEKDRDRPMYGLKEKAIAKILVKVLKINKDSEDGDSILNWKNPGRASGDFPGRCHEVLKKRAMRSKVGTMRIAEVNELLDRLASFSKEDEQRSVFEEFYERMNADEMTWLIRIILRQMKVGATEKTFLNLWHPDGDALFNVSSSLRRVCWELADPSLRLDKEQTDITLMECFQPQLAQFQMHSFSKMIEKVTTHIEDEARERGDDEFWIEEKLDGERMQLHMEETDDEENYPGGRKFGFWSRKGKDYTYLYGSSFGDDDSALTRFIKDSFDPQVRSIILDGEMITWDPEADVMVGFGTLKTAAISEKTNPFGGTGHRPLFRVFDCLYLNGQDISQYQLRSRRRALERSVKDIHRRIEVHRYDVATTQAQIESQLRTVVAEACEGLVLKNPRSKYTLNDRNDAWIKVKPEYMTEFGESLDCVVIGGYYGTGHRGGRLSSFLCGLRVDTNHIDKGANPEKCFSFFKVGGGLRSGDFAKIKYLTEGKWVNWDINNPPTEYIELGGASANRQHERPDVWIRPSESIVVEVKAASVETSERFATSYTLRFPRFKKLRDDKSWKEALSVYGFEALKKQAEADSKTKKFDVAAKRKTGGKRLKKEMVIAGNDSKIKTPYAGPKSELFEGLNFFVMTEMVKPKKSKAEIEQMIKSNGGSVFQSAAAENNTVICVGDRNTVKVASIIKAGERAIIKPAWIIDTLTQAGIDGPLRRRRSNFLLPFEPKRHFFHCPPQLEPRMQDNTDEYGDSYARDLSPEDLKSLLDGMIPPKHSDFNPIHFLAELEDRGRGFSHEMRGELFRGCIIYLIPSHARDAQEERSVDVFIAKNRFLFGGGLVVDDDDDDDDERITHFVSCGGRGNQAEVRELRAKISRRVGDRERGRGRGRVPRFVDLRWIEESWAEKTRLDEDGFVLPA